MGKVALKGNFCVVHGDTTTNRFKGTTASKYDIRLSEIQIYRFLPVKFKRVVSKNVHMSCVTTTSKSYICVSNQLSEL